MAKREIVSPVHWRDYAGRFSVEFEIANRRDLVAVELGVITPDKVRKLKISGLVDTGASRLVLPKAIAEELGLPEEGKLYVRYADGRRAKRTVVQDAQVTMLGRTGVFSAIVEPRQKDALIGAIVLEELDLIPDCSAQKLLPRDPAGVLAEIE